MWRAALFFTLCSCGAVSFGVEQDLPRQDIQGSLLGGVLPSFLPTSSRFTIDLSAEVQKRGTGPARAAYLKTLTLVIAPNTPSASFDFLDDVHLFAEGPGLAKVEIAKLQPVPKGLTTLKFEIVPDVDLLPYINAGATLSASASATQPRTDTSFTGKVEVEVRI
ncbi:MAG: hypothetical protein JNK82_24990 [Myxococcaceae bacterium]|nr:hypothetical protein [Myxococcaceae bacterium]